MDHTQSLLSSLVTNVVSSVRLSRQLAALDINFYASVDESVAQALESSEHAILQTVELLANLGDLPQPLSLQSSDDVEENWSAIVDTLDTLYERTSIALASPAEKDQAQPQAIHESMKPQTCESSKIQADQVVLRSSKIKKPQLNFKQPVKNTPSVPFVPLLTQKPHSAHGNADAPFVPKLLEPEADNELPHYEQPYDFEIRNSSYPAELLNSSSVINPKDWTDNGLVMVTSGHDLHVMIQDLKQASVIAVDLEHHDYRSYHGFVCLMQITSPEKDYIVDTLILRDELQILNEVFTDPKIVKVFHGAFMDIMWLQRDFGLYVVSLFDTYPASKALGLPRHGLSHLLETYVDFKASKKYQLADWRQRPLPSVMIDYARADTHFLLYIFCKIRNQLRECAKLESVLEESRNVALQRYEYPAYNENLSSDIPPAWYVAWSRSPLSQSRQSLVKCLWSWRDTKARELDESTRYVMPTHAIITLASTLPKDVPELLEAVGVSKLGSNLIAKYATELCKIILDAKDEILSEEAKESKTVGETAVTEPVQNEDLDSLMVETDTSKIFKYTREVAEIMETRNSLGGDASQLSSTHSSFYSPQARNYEPDVIKTRLSHISRVLTLSVPLPEFDYELTPEEPASLQLHTNPHETDKEQILNPEPEVTGSKRKKNAKKLNLVDDSAAPMSIPVSMGRVPPPPRLAASEPEEKIFDYNAASQLSTRETKQSETPFDPYGKSKPVVQGAKKRKQALGKSMSFKKKTKR